MDAITKEFIATIRSNAENEEVGDIMPELARLNLESKTLYSYKPETICVEPKILA